MIKNYILKDLEKAVESLGFENADIVISIPENPNFGDYTTNIALQLAKLKKNKHYQSSLDTANEILGKIGHPHYMEAVEVAGPGFINFFIKDEVLISSIGEKVDKRQTIHDKRKYLIEYAQPNTHKEFHIGHFRNISIGESLARLLELEGNEVFRVTYGSDIGLPVAKALWAVNKFPEEYQKARKGDLKDKMEFLGKVYVEGSSAYEKDLEAAEDIQKIIGNLYERKGEYLKLWEETKNWSKDYLNSMYKLLGTKFDVQIWESDIEKDGTKIVKEHLGTVFVENEGAIIFPGEKYALHTRVFITSAGYPTYEAKEIGLTNKEFELFPYDKSLHIVDTQQSGFFQVVNKALELINQDIKDKKIHIPYGFVSLNTGRMSSRTGNLVTALELIDQVKQEILKSFPKLNKKLDQELLSKISIGAIKFYFLKFGLISDITFNVKESVSLQGDSGPYIQYAYARTQSLLRKSTVNSKQITGRKEQKLNLELEERELLRWIEYFDLKVEEAAGDLKPNVIAEYLLELAKAFNLFYQKWPIIGSKKMGFRIRLTEKVGDVLKKGLYLLGIETPERM